MARKRKRKPEIERFLQKVKLPASYVPGNGPVVDECWLWLGAITSSGHGNFRMWDHHKNKWKMISAHKYAYLHYKGSMKQPWLMLRHKCDVRRCVNPEHLEEGTQGDNMKDMMERNRGKGQFKSPDTMTQEEIDECPF